MKSNPSLTVIAHPVGSSYILCDISAGSLRPLVPLQLCRKLFEQIQNISHPGVRASRRLISSRFVWPGMSGDVGLWAKSCIPCQKSEISTHVHASVPSIPVPTRRFSHIHVDIVGPLPVSQGYSYLFTMKDRTTRWPEAVPLSSISAESCVRAFISTWVSRSGVPAVLTSDRGSQFTSSIWTGVCSILGISASTMTSFHPQSNGMVERFHRSLKSSLRAKLASSDWVSHLPLVLLGLIATPKDDTGLSVSVAVYGAPLTLLGELVEVPELLPDTFLRKVNRAIEGFAIPPPHHVRPVPPVQLPLALISAKYIFVCEDTAISSLAPSYRGPYLVIDRRGKYFRLQIGSKQDVFSDTPVTSALPPPRGRPRLSPASVSSGTPPSSATKSSKKVRFLVNPQVVPPPIPLRQNPYRSARDRRICSAISPPFLLGGLLWRI